MCRKLSTKNDFRRLEIGRTGLAAGEQNLADEYKFRRASINPAGRA
jgi:hypothetical protein